jgi:CRISPR-associated protein (TIGR02584 family)
MNYLVAITGLDPHVITQAMWCFDNQYRIHFDQIVIITTKRGYDVLQNGDSKRGFVPFLSKQGPLITFCDEFGLKPLTPEVFVMVGADNKPIDDVVSSSNLEAAAYSILNTIRDIRTVEGDHVYCIYSGGRRVMASYLMSALSLIGTDRHSLYYVHHSPQDADKDPSFFYKPIHSRKMLIPGKDITTNDVTLEVAEIVFPKLGSKYADLIRRDKTYRSIVNHVQSYLNQESKPIVRLMAEDESEPVIIGKSAKLQETLRLVKRFALKGISPLLLIGETGTGKELLARYYYYWFNKDKPKKTNFVTINCGAIPKELIESEMFGAYEGAYTGATHDQQGYLLDADGGVAFLDELNSAPLSFQAKLLKVLDDGEIQMLGSRKHGGKDSKKVNVKIVAAMNQDVQALISKGEFREDFYYRLKKGKIIVPSLRERREDLPELIRFMVSKAGFQYNIPDVKLSEKVIDILCGLELKGNICDLQNIIERLVALAESDQTGVINDIPVGMDLEEDSMTSRNIPPEDILDVIVKNHEEKTFEQLVEGFERWLIINEYERNKKNAARTAKALKIPSSTLKDKLEKYGLK